MFKTRFEHVNLHVQKRTGCSNELLVVQLVRYLPYSSRQSGTTLKKVRLHSKERRFRRLRPGRHASDSKKNIPAMSQNTPLFTRLPLAAQIFGLGVLGCLLVFLWSGRKKDRFPIKTPGNLGENVVLGLGVLGVHFYCKHYEKNNLQKFHRIILLHLGLVIVRMRFGKTHHFSWFSDFQTCLWLPKPAAFIFGGTRRLQIIQEISQIILNILCL